MRETLQGKTFRRRYRSDSEIVSNDRHAVVPRSHIGFKGERYTVFALLNSEIGESVNLIVIRYGRIHFGILRGILICCPKKNHAFHISL